MELATILIVLSPVIFAVVLISTYELVRELETRRAIRLVRVHLRKPEVRR